MTLLWLVEPINILADCLFRSSMLLSHVWTCASSPSICALMPAGRIRPPRWTRCTRCLTGSMSALAYPRSHHPKPPATGQTQANVARRKLKRRLRLRHLNEMQLIPQTRLPKSKAVSTKSDDFVIFLHRSPRPLSGNRQSDSRSIDSLPPLRGHQLYCTEARKSLMFVTTPRARIYPLNVGVGKLSLSKAFM